MLAVSLFYFRAQAPHESTATTVTHFYSAEQRLVVVSADESDRLPMAGEGDRVLSALLLAGEIPAGQSEATVVTDLNCQADEEGISHCTNDILIGEAQVALQHDHDMREVPCLTPGEVVQVMSLATYRAQQ